MTAQTYLFEPHREPLHPAARHSDPSTSHEAAAAVKRSGMTARHREMVLDLIFMKPGSTTHELAKLSRERHGEDALSNQQINRRTAELLNEERAESSEQLSNKHLSRRCQCGEKRCARQTMQTWWPAPERKMEV